MLPLFARSVYGANARMEMCSSGWLQGWAPLVYSKKSARDPHPHARRMNCIESMILLCIHSPRVFELGLPTLPSPQGENGALKDICSLGLDEWEWVSKVCKKYIFFLPVCRFFIFRVLMRFTLPHAFHALSCRLRRLCPNGISFATTSGRFQPPIQCFSLDSSVRSPHF